MGRTNVNYHGNASLGTPKRTVKCFLFVFVFFSLQLSNPIMCLIVIHSSNGCQIMCQMFCIFNHCHDMDEILVMVVSCCGVTTELLSGCIHCLESQIGLSEKFSRWLALCLSDSSSLAYYACWDGKWCIPLFL